MRKNKVCVIIPCYKVKKKIISGLKKIDFKIVDKVVIVDDYCPENSGKFVKKTLNLKKFLIFF